MQIRTVEITDAKRIIELNEQLGYQTSISTVEQQIKAIQLKDDHYLFAAIEDDQFIGYIHGFISSRLTTNPFMEIAGLIIEEKFRGKGIGRGLINHLEKHINGAKSLRVRCNVNRKSAHEFYIALNYNEIKEQKVFERKLN